MSVLLLGGILALQDPLRYHVLSVVRFPFAVVKGTVRAVLTLPRLPALREEHEQLRAELLERQREVAQLREALRHATEAQRLLAAGSAAQGLVASVIDRSRIPTQHTLLVDRGSRDGLVLDSAVVNADGAVGRVVELFPTSALVLLLTDAESRIAAVVERTRETGLLVGRSRGQCELIYLEVQADVQPGDRVVTAGLGGSFSKGLFLGIVDRVSRDEQRGTAWASVRPAANLGRLEEVLCLPPSP